MDYEGQFMWAMIARNLGVNSAPALMASAEFRDGVAGSEYTRRALAVGAVCALRRQATVNVSVVTATLNRDTGAFDPTDESLDAAVEREIARLEAAGFEVVTRDAGGGCGDGGDYHAVNQVVVYGLPAESAAS